MSKSASLTRHCTAAPTLLYTGVVRQFLAEVPLPWARDESVVVIVSSIIIAVVIAIQKLS